MLLSCRFLLDVQGVNSFEAAPQLEITAGDAQTLYFQLVDASLDRLEQGFSPAGRRYIPPVGSTLQVTFVNTDDAKKVVRAASHPFATDGSIWSVPVLASDPIRGTTALKVVLSEPGPRLLSANFPVGFMIRVR